jgi:hypothetical protein
MQLSSAVYCQTLKLLGNTGVASSLLSLACCTLHSGHGWVYREMHVCTWLLSEHVHSMYLTPSVACAQWGHLVPRIAMYHTEPQAASDLFIMALWRSGASYCKWVVATGFERAVLLWQCRGLDAGLVVAVERVLVCAIGCRMATGDQTPAVCWCFWVLGTTVCGYGLLTLPVCLWHNVSPAAESSPRRQALVCVDTVQCSTALTWTAARFVEIYQSDCCQIRDSCRCRLSVPRF